MRAQNYWSPLGRQALCRTYHLLFTSLVICKCSSFFIPLFHIVRSKSARREQVIPTRNEPSTTNLCVRWSDLERNRWEKKVEEDEEFFCHQNYLSSSEQIGLYRESGIFNRFGPWWRGKRFLIWECMGILNLIRSVVLHQGVVNEGHVKVEVSTNKNISPLYYYLESSWNFTASYLARVATAGYDRIVGGSERGCTAKVQRSVPIPIDLLHHLLGFYDCICSLHGLFLLQIRLSAEKF